MTALQILACVVVKHSDVLFHIDCCHGDYDGWEDIRAESDAKKTNKMEGIAASDGTYSLMGTEEDFTRRFIDSLERDTSPSTMEELMAWAQDCSSKAGMGVCFAGLR